ncbi:MAG: hypothetical protein GX599_08415, partial [Chloroflexi bacterium]|nr:hypothetical protein [Chloroflexota bacterium]
FIDLLNKSQLEKPGSETQADFSGVLEAGSGAENLTLAHLAQEGLRAGVLLLEDEEGIGACELLPSKEQEGEVPASNQSQWQILQMRLAKKADHASLFMLLLEAAVRETWRAGGRNLSVLPLDDIAQPRPALPERYDAAEIGYASFYARAGFRRLEAVRGSRWGIRND